MESENKSAKFAALPDVRLPDPHHLIISTSPHIQDKETISGIMLKVLLCLSPAIIASILFFGWAAVKVLLICAASCVLCEYLWCLMVRRPQTVKDCSALVTGVILAMNLPPGIPWWVCVIGGFIAIIVAKEVFGGLGQNPFNPAAVARVALLIGFAGPMSSGWLMPRFALKTESGSFVTGATAQAANAAGDAVVQTAEAVHEIVTSATPLTLAKHAHSAAELAQITSGDALWSYFFGNAAGSLGETSALALLIGGIALICFRIISWHIPVAMLGTTFLFTWMVHLSAPDLTPGPVFHVLTGGMMIAAFFMATDMVTCPITRRGKILYGALIALIACVIRIWGGYPEGVSFAIVLLNACVPLIDRFSYRRPFGWTSTRASAIQIRRGEVK